MIVDFGGWNYAFFPLCIVLLEVVARGHPIAWPWSIDWVTQVNHLTDLVRPPWTWAIQGMKSLLNHWFNLLLSVDAVSFRALLGARFCAPTRDVHSLKRRSEAFQRRGVNGVCATNFCWNLRTNHLKPWYFTSMTVSSPKTFIPIFSPRISVISDFSFVFAPPNH